MGRAQIERTRVEELKSRISESERRRKELINYLQGLKDKLLDRELVYSEYNEIIEKKSDGKTIPDWINYYENYINDCKGLIDKEKRGFIVRRIFSVFLFSFIGLLLIFALFNMQTLIGFVVKEEKQEFVQNIGLEFSETGDYEWGLDNAGDLLSAKLSGNVEGEGAVKIYLDNLLIFDSEKLKGQEQGAKITGQVAGELGNESYSEENSEEASQKKLSPSQEELPASETEKRAVKTEFADICEETCNLGKLNLNKSYYTLRIEITNAKLKMDTIRYEIIPFAVEVVGREENITALENVSLPEENITIPENVTINITRIENITGAQINISNISSEVKQYRAVINKPVKWIKIVKISEQDREGNISIEIPKESQNISVKTGGEVSDALAEIEAYENIIEDSDRKDFVFGAITGNVALDIKSNQGFLTRLWGWLKGFTITGNVIQEEELKGKIVETENSKTIELKDIAELTQASEIAVEYYTEGPSGVEEETKSGKRIIVSGGEEMNYTDILAFAEIPDIFDIGQEEKIRIYWKEEGRYINFSAYDLDGNGKIDYVEWVVPHLSNQTFDIILITKAEHLDKDRNFISDIYEQVKELDGNWSESISDGHYVRVTFERKLDNTKDITLYPRVISGEPKIEVYEIEGNETIAEFSSLKENEYNKVFLTNLIGEQDGFDLRVVGGSVEIEHIIDPPEVILLIGKSGTLCGEVNNYTTIIINGSGILNICPYITAGTGFVNITLGSYGNFTIIDGGIVNGSGAGVAGGAGTSTTVGRSTQGTRGDTRAAGSALTAANAGGGGGGNRTSGSTAGTGGGGGFGNTGGRGGNVSTAQSYPGTGGAAYGSSNDASILYVGSGGGGGSGDASNAGGRGGGGFSVNAGSGSIVIEGIINVSGRFGVGVDSTDSAGGGGGSGGHIILIGNTINVSLAKIDVRGGRGGNTGANVRDCGGGGGGGGRVVFVYQSLTNSSASIFSDGGAAGSGACTRPPVAGDAGSEYWNLTTADWPAVDWEYPSFNNYWDDNATKSGTGIANFNVTLNSTNGTVLFYINGTNYTATNLTGLHFNVSVFLNNNTYDYQWMSWGNGTDDNFNISTTRYYTINETLIDNEYPSFINAWDNNGTLNSTGIAFFNVTILSNNGSALLQINGTNFTATNWTDTLFNISIITVNNTYNYQWISWGNGSSHNINKSIIRYYTVNETLIDNEYPSFNNYWDDNATKSGTGIANFNVTLNSTNGTVLFYINGTNYTATNLTGLHFNVSVLMSNGTFAYQWMGWGNGTSHHFNTTANRFYTLNTTTNTAPQIISVTAIDSTDPTMNDIVSIAFNFSVFDNDGATNLNSASVMANFSKTGEPLRENSTCMQKEAAGDYANYSCTIEMWYFDDAGNWNITAYIKDTPGEIAFNDSTKFQYNLLKAVVISPNSFTFSAIIGATNQTPSDDPTIINNTGNYNITNISVRGVHLYGERDSSYFIGVENFTVGNNTGGTPPLECIGGGTPLVNGSEIQITNASLIRGNLSQGSGAGQEQIYYCLNQVPSGISSQTYSTLIGGSWVVKILLVVFVPARRRKKEKKNIREDNLVASLNLIANEMSEQYSAEKEKILELLIGEIKKKYRLNNGQVSGLIKTRKAIEIPLNIFSGEIGGLEIVCKYMKENLGMGYREIAKKINRDERTIWTAYKKAVEKQKKPIEVKKADIFFPISIFKDRRFTVLELVIVYLRKKQMRYNKIAGLIGRDQRNVWTIYSRAVKKENNKI